MATGLLHRDTAAAHAVIDVTGSAAELPCSPEDSTCQRCVRLCCPHCSMIAWYLQHVANMSHNVTCPTAHTPSARPRLRELASAGSKASWPEEYLQRRLLDQLQALPGWSEVDPDTLLADYRDLQMMALYNGPEADSGNDQQAMQAVGDVMVPVGKKGFDRELEEFLVQQVRTARLCLKHLPRGRGHCFVSYKAQSWGTTLVQVGLVFALQRQKLRPGPRVVLSCRIRSLLVTSLLDYFFIGPNGTPVWPRQYDTV